MWRQLEHLVCQPCPICPFKDRPMVNFNWPLLSVRVEPYPLGHNMINKNKIMSISALLHFSLFNHIVERGGIDFTDTLCYMLIKSITAYFNFENFPRRWENFRNHEGYNFFKGFGKVWSIPLCLKLVGVCLQASSSLVTGIDMNILAWHSAVISCANMASWLRSWVKYLF